MMKKLFHPYLLKSFCFAFKAKLVLLKFELCQIKL